MQKLYEKALEAYNNSYSPYSNFKVGAALLCKDGNIIIGTNVENASFGLSNCAERTAMFNAIASGYKPHDFDCLMVIGNTENPISPCGACREVMKEILGLDCKVILTNLKDERKEMKVSDLLPYSFFLEDNNE